VAEQLDVVAGGGVAECGGVDRPGVGQAELAGGFAGLGRGVLEAGGGGELQGVQWLVRADQEGVRAVDRE
jgi:hypothetical protein